MTIIYSAKPQSAYATRSIETNIFIPNLIDNFSSLSATENDLGLKFHATKWYLDWNEDFTSDIANQIHNHGTVPELTWQPQKNSIGVAYNDVIQGSYDTYISNFATAVKNLGFPIRISLAPEMNINSVSWAIGKQGNTADNHKQFWRYVVTKFNDAGATNIQWIWSPNTRSWGDTISYNDIYPGDSYVTFVGLDGYNWGTTQSWSTWQSFREVFDQSYNEMTALTSKKILLMEVASTEKGGDKAQWIRDMMSDLQTRFTQIQGFTWFDMNKETDWRIDSSQGAKIAFIEAFTGVLTKVSGLKSVSAQENSQSVTQSHATKPKLSTKPASQPQVDSQVTFLPTTANINNDSQNPMVFVTTQTDHAKDIVSLTILGLVVIALLQIWHQFRPQFLNQRLIKIFQTFDTIASRKLRYLT